MAQRGNHVTVIGAGIGGLAAALRLAHAGLRVTVLERHVGPGGKMRTVPSVAGPVDAGPTVLTMKPVFDALFADVGLRLSDYVTLQQEPILARHFWHDGAVLDLTTDAVQNAEAVGTCFGSTARAEFLRFSNKARKLFEAFDAPMMQSGAPSQAHLAMTVMRRPSLLAAMAPHQSLARSLAKQFSEPRLAQLFARYATYVGGLPAEAPAILSLIWHAEHQGVWHVAGGMHKLALAIEAAAKSLGVTFIYNADVTRIEMQNGQIANVRTRNDNFETDIVVFNGDPRALTRGLLGPAITDAIAITATEPRSLSAYVASFAAVASGPDLAAHNVFFADDPAREYGPLASRQMQIDPTLYVCAQDRFGGARPSGPERFEIIMNAAPVRDATPIDQKERLTCQSLICDRLARFNLQFSPMPEPDVLTMPAHYAAMFPASNGSLYGRSPQGLMAAFKRPTARTAVPGLYLAGGGAHPGAGVPMATLSAQHAVAAIRNDRSLILTSPAADTPGGTSTGSVTTAAKPYQS